MQHADQHVRAIRQSVRIEDKITASIFDDKVKPMGVVTVSKGQIVVVLDYVPSMITPEARRDFITDVISLALKECYDRKAHAFDPHSMEGKP